MNRRIYKKLCKRAMERLIAKHGYRRDEFWIVGRDHFIFCDVSKKCGRRCWRSQDPELQRVGILWVLKGTPGVWSSIPETDDSDFVSAFTVLDELEPDWRDFGDTMIADPAGAAA